jgi:hypothetical protein
MNTTPASTPPDQSVVSSPLLISLSVVICCQIQFARTGRGRSGKGTAAQIAPCEFMFMYLNYMIGTCGQRNMRLF